ncbi:hypothetical protein AAMO2058_001117700 [Amorphochlora amoebiformis]
MGSVRRFDTTLSFEKPLKVNDNTRRRDDARLRVGWGIRVAHTDMQVIAGLAWVPIRVGKPRIPRHADHLSRETMP